MASASHQAVSVFPHIYFIGYITAANLYLAIKRFSSWKNEAVHSVSHTSSIFVQFEMGTNGFHCRVACNKIICFFFLSQTQRQHTICHLEWLDYPLLSIIWMMMMSMIMHRKENCCWLFTRREYGRPNSFNLENSTISIRDVRNAQKHTIKYTGTYICEYPKQVLTYWSLKPLLRLYNCA